jgi:hypothetical protein
MPKKIAHKDPLNLALRYDMQAAIPGLRLVRMAVMQ